MLQTDSPSVCGLVPLVPLGAPRSFRVVDAKGEKSSRQIPRACAAWSPLAPFGTPCSLRVLDVKERDALDRTPSRVRLGPHLHPMVPSGLGRKRGRCSRQTFPPPVRLGLTWHLSPLPPRRPGVQGIPGGKGTKGVLRILKNTFGTRPDGVNPKGGLKVPLLRVSLTTCNQPPGPLGEGGWRGSLRGSGPDGHGGKGVVSPSPGLPPPPLHPLPPLPRPHPPVHLGRGVGEVL